MSPFKKMLFCASGGVLFILSLVIVFKEKGLYDLKKQRHQLSVSVKENEMLRNTNKALFHEVKRLKKDDIYIEHVARKELRMIKGDEIVIQFLSEKKNDEK